MARRASDTATRVWQEVVASGDDGIDVDTIAATLAAEYGADPQVVRILAPYVLEEVHVAQLSEVLASLPA